LDERGIANIVYNKLSVDREDSEQSNLEGEEVRKNNE